MYVSAGFHDFETAAFMRLGGLYSIIYIPAKLNNYPDTQIIFPVNSVGKSPITHCNQVSITGQIPQIW